MDESVLEENLCFRIIEILFSLKLDLVSDIVSITKTVSAFQKNWSLNLFYEVSFFPSLSFISTNLPSLIKLLLGYIR